MEVVVNHLKPYKIEGELNHLFLEEKLRIDTESVSVAETGLTEIYYFDVDSEGNIFFSNDRSRENIILKFDRNGNFVTAFGRMGQGPGELQMAILPIITSQGEVLIMDQGQRKLCYFTKEGDFIKIGNRILEVVETGKNVVCKDLKNNITKTISPVKLQKGELVANPDVRKSVVSSVAPDEIQILDLKTYETHDLKNKKNNFALNPGDEIKILIFGNRVYVI